MGTQYFPLWNSLTHWHLSVSRDHRFSPIVQRLLWLWRLIREWQSLPHLENMKAAAGLVRHTVFCGAFSPSLLLAVFLHIVTALVVLCVSRHLCLWQPLPTSLCLCQALGGLACIRLWSVVGFVLFVFSLLPVHHIKGLLECSHISSVSHVLAIAFAFALRECVCLVSRLFPASHYLSPCPAMWFPGYIWGSACETHSTFSLGVRA